MSLESKNILICRRPEQSRELVKQLKKLGAIPVVFPTFETIPLPISQSMKAELEQQKNYSHLLLGSENGARYFARIVKELHLDQQIKQLQLNTVGQKAANEWSKNFPDHQIGKSFTRLQHFLDEMGNRQKGADMIKILNPTSEQSLENIDVNIPGFLELKRIPIYRTTTLESYSREELDRIVATEYDAVYLSSPSSFNGLIELLGKKWLDSDPAIIAAGPTTASHILKTGVPVSIVPSSPAVRAVINALELYFSKHKRKKILDENR